MFRDFAAPYLTKKMPLVGIAALMLGVFLFFDGAQQTRICKGENGFEYIEVSCLSTRMPLALFFDGKCKFSLKVSGESEVIWASQGEAIRTSNLFAFQVSSMGKLYDIDMMAHHLVTDQNPLLVSVDFGRHTVDLRGAIFASFKNCVFA